MTQTLFESDESDESEDDIINTTRSAILATQHVKKEEDLEQSPMAIILTDYIHSCSYL